MRGKDAVGLALLAILPVLLFAPILGTGRIFFLGDLTYFYHPWRVLPAEMIQRGLLPLWDPYSYLGMPLLGRFQTGTFAPGTLPFLLFPFPAAYKAHLLLHHALAGVFAYLWLGRLGGRWGALTAAAAFSLGGFLAARVGLVNVTATLAWWPAFFLFAGRPVLLGLAMAGSLLAGYPPTWAGMLLGAALLSRLWSRRFAWRSWLAATVLALGLSACLLLPGLELIVHSSRWAAMPLDERTAFSLKPRELLGALSPAFSGEGDPAGAKYPLAKTLYLGLGASGLALLGFLSAGRKRWRLAAYMAAVMLFILGRENPLSLWLWETLPGLGLLRYPGNLSFLIIAPALPLIARGLNKKRWAAAACLLVCVELLYYGRNMQPTMPNGYFTERGPLAEWLDTALHGERYALSPRAALSLQGFGATAEERYRDIKHRLYGLANLPYHLPAATAMGESLVPAANYGAMDFLFSRSGAAEAARSLPALGVKFLLMPEEPPAGLGISRRKTLWNAVELAAPARAWWVPESRAALLAGGFDGAPALAGAAPLSYQAPREDRFSVSGTAPAKGWALIANPRYPGWRAFLDGNPVEIRPALSSIQMAAVGPGPFRLDFHYRPNSFRAGAWASLLCLLLLSREGLRRNRLISS